MEKSRNLNKGINKKIIMSESEKYLLKFRTYIFKAPSIVTSSLTITVILLIYEIFARIRISDIILVFVLPFFLTMFLDYLILKYFKLYFPKNRIALLNEVTFILCFAIFLVTLVATNYDALFSILLSFSIATFIRFLFYSPFLNIKILKYNLVSLNYTWAISILYILDGTRLVFIIPFLLSSIVFLVSGKFFVRFLTRDFVKEYDTNPLEYIGSFVNYLSTQTPEDLLSLNKFLVRMYSVKEVPVTLISFKTDNNIKALFLFPYVHPGPFGEVGCSNFPYKLAMKLNNITPNIFIFHTSTTHDDNCGGDEDVDKIYKAINENIKSLSYDSSGSNFRRFNDEVTYNVQRFGKAVMVSFVPDKKGFDDIDFDFGMKLIRKFRSASLKDISIVDAHNYFDSEYISLKSLANETIKRMKANINELQRASKLEMGIAFSNEKHKSLGPLGIKVCVIKTETERVGYVIYDGNNIKKGLRDKVLERTKEKFDQMEVFSTDNHIVNLSTQDLNPVGNYQEEEEIINKTIELLNKAETNLEPVAVGSKTFRLLLKVAGKGYISKITEITKKEVGKLKDSFLFAIVSILFAILIFYLFKVL